MITRGAPDQASAPQSPSSMAGAAPSDSEPQPVASPDDGAAAADPVDVVDVTGTEEPWTAAPARRTTEPAPLRATKRSPAKPLTGAALSAARKGKKKLAKRAAPSAIAGSSKSAAVEGDVVSDPDVEDKLAPPSTKKARKTAVRASTRTPEASASTSRPTPNVERADGGFNLSSFMASFESGTAASAVPPPAASRTLPEDPQPQPSSDHSTAEMVHHFHALKAEVERLRALVAQQAAHAVVAPSLGRTGNVTSAVTTPNAKGEMPPAELCYLTSASFPEGLKKSKGDYNPPQAHLLAGSRMFRGFGGSSGKGLSAMSFVLWMRELESVKFQVTPAVLMAIFSGRLGSRGLTLMHFKESTDMSVLESGSTNANFSSDFSPSANLPPATIRCSSYEDILDALHGLNAFGQEVWYDHMRKLISRLRTFVSRNKSADPANTPARVRLTLLYANKYLGTALGHMQADDPQWWSGFCEALRAVDYQSSGWTMALVSCLTQDDGEGARTTPRASGIGARRDTPRRPAIPESMRRLIPINRKGQEPCLLNVAGLPCSGGSRDRCGNPRRAHNWPERLPTRLQEWVESTYGSRPHGDERRM